MYAGAHIRAVPARTQEWDHKVEESSAPAGGERQAPSVAVNIKTLIAGTSARWVASSLAKRQDRIRERHRCLLRWVMAHIVE
jgi:hypothetical protein